MVQIALTVSAVLVTSVQAHGTMYEPPSRASGGQKMMRPACPMGACLWFNQGCTSGCPFCTGGGSVVPSEPDCRDHAEPTLAFKDKQYRTYALSPLQHVYGDWTKYKPWRYPGSAPVRDPCGIAGGWFTRGTPGNGGEAPIGFEQGVLGSNLTAVPKLLEETVWIAGSVVEVAWGIMANHGGGYQYRLCPADAETSEACFQQMPLKFVGETSWIQRGKGMDVNDRVEIAAVTIPGDKVVPLGSTWRRNPIPACNTPISGGAIHTPCLHPIFTPPFKGKEGESWGFGGGTCESTSGGVCSDKEFARHYFDLGIVDKVEVPDVPEGEYALSFRWDSEQTPQVWSQCADVTIKKSGTSTKAFGETKGCTPCCTQGGICSNCSTCVDDRTGACAYCWNPLPGYAPGAPPIVCLGHDDPATGAATEWRPGMSSKTPIGLGCTKCLADADGCSKYTRDSDDAAFIA